jgi:hypothetical protein
MYNIGDYVRIKDDLVVHKTYNEMVYTQTMDDIKRRYSTYQITNVEEWGFGYVYEINHERYHFHFTDEMLEPVDKTFKIEILKYPTESDWQWVKTCTLNTVGKTSTKAPTKKWKKQLLEAEHSPIRELWFGIKMTIPYWVSVHFVRHHIGVNHYVQTQRTDRTGVNREELSQGEYVSHIMSINAQELMFMARKRLCKQASLETRTVMQLICSEVIKVCPELEGLLVPLCKYRNGKCSEMFPCYQEVKDE